MKITIINRRGLLRAANEYFCTTAPCSRYVGVRVASGRLIFSHTNGDGFKVVPIGAPGTAMEQFDDANFTRPFITVH